MSKIDEIITTALLSELKEINNRIAPILKQVEPDLELKKDIEDRLKAMGYSPQSSHLKKQAEKPIVTTQSPLKVELYSEDDSLINKALYVLKGHLIYMSVPEIIEELKKYEPALANDAEELRRYQSVITTALKKKWDAGKVFRKQDEKKGFVYSVEE